MQLGVKGTADQATIGLLARAGDAVTAAVLGRVKATLRGDWRRP